MWFERKRITPWPSIRRRNQDGTDSTPGIHILWFSALLDARRIAATARETRLVNGHDCKTPPDFHCRLTAAVKLARTNDCVEFNDAGTHASGREMDREAEVVAYCGDGGANDRGTLRAPRVWRQPGVASHGAGARSRPAPSLRPNGGPPPWRPGLCTPVAHPALKERQTGAPTGTFCSCLNEPVDHEGAPVAS